jgi:alanine-synthesizing transaminase
MFASRLRQTEGRNRLAAAIDQRRAAGLPIADLTLSNPTRAGLAYPSGLLASLADDRSLRYDPVPFGLPEARRAVSDELARRGAAVPVARTVLTASTSEAYSLLFKLLCDPGDAVLAPRPSYPLVEHLTHLDGVALDHYRLEFHGRWEIDLEQLREKAAAARMRAIIMVTPNNPTGSVMTGQERQAVASIARAHDLALISDEVFADYPICGGRVGSALAQDAALTFVLGGLSKSVGLPQMKLGWIGVGGPATVVADAIDRLETICDAYLSVSTPVQRSAADLLQRGAMIRSQIHERVRANYAQLQQVSAAHPSCGVLPVEAGWYAVVQVPAVASEETIVLELLERTGVLVHPGYFFDFEREAFLVLSLLPQPDVFASATQALFDQIGRVDD